MARAKRTNKSDTTELGDNSNAGRNKQASNLLRVLQVDTQKLKDIGIVVVAWLLALTLVYTAITKITMLFK